MFRRDRPGVLPQNPKRAPLTVDSSVMCRVFSRHSAPPVWDSSLRLRPVELHPASGHECSSLEDISLPAPLVIALSLKLEKHANYCVEFAVFVSTDLGVEHQSPPTCSACGRVELKTPPTVVSSCSLYLHRIVCRVLVSPRSTPHVVVLSLKK